MDNSTKRNSISLDILAKRALGKPSGKWSHEELVDALNKLTHLRLDREGFKIIDNMELLGKNLTNLYMQNNNIEKIENLECLINLRFLTLSHNVITALSGLKPLKKLGLLDLSHNRIAKVDVSELPSSLIILNLQGNPCAKIPGHRNTLIGAMPSLQQLDGKDVSELDNAEISGDYDQFDPDRKFATDELRSFREDAVKRMKELADADVKQHKRTMQLLQEMKQSNEKLPGSNTAK